MNKTEKNTLNLFASNNYWGRGLFIGNVNNKIAVAYFIMGRSENSRNRYFYQEGDKLVIAPYDESKVEDPSLIIYYPIKKCGNKLIVTNGDQTDTVEDFLIKGKTFEDALGTRKFEPDSPHFTPRISGLIDLETGRYKLSILKNMDGIGEACGRYFYDYENVSGQGHFIHTYEGNGNPLPTFEGEPWNIEFTENFDTFTNTIWNNLDADNKISLCTLFIDPAKNDYEIKILNKNMGD